MCHQSRNTKGDQKYLDFWAYVATVVTPSGSEIQNYKDSAIAVIG